MNRGLSRTSWVAWAAIAALFSGVGFWWWWSRPHTTKDFLKPGYVESVEVLIDGRPIELQETWAPAQAEVRVIRGPKLPPDQPIWATLHLVPKGVISTNRKKPMTLYTVELREAYPQNRLLRGDKLPKLPSLPVDYPGVRFVGTWGLNSAGEPKSLTEETEFMAILTVTLEQAAPNGEPPTRGHMIVHQFPVRLERSPNRQSGIE